MRHVKPEKVDVGLYRLDLRGFVCPYPQVFTAKALELLNVGEILEVIVDNPASCENVPSAVSRKGHSVLGVEKIGAGVWRIRVRRGGDR